MAVYSYNTVTPLSRSPLPPHKMYLYIHATKMHTLLKVRWPRAIWGNLKMHLGPWTCSLLRLIPSSMERLYTNSYVPNYNKHRYITDGLCICLHMSHRPLAYSYLRKGSLICVSPAAFFFFHKRFFLHFSWPGLRVWQRVSQLYSW